MVVGPGRARLMTSMPIPTAERLRVQAEREGRTVSSMIKWAIECYLREVNISDLTSQSS